MKEISIGRLRQNPTAMIREVQDGETYTLTDRGRPVAQIVPVRGPRPRTFEQVNAFIDRYGGDEEWADEIDRGRDDSLVEDPWERAAEQEREREAERAQEAQRGR